MKWTSRTEPILSEPTEWLHTWIGSSTPDTITLAGRDLPSEVMGHYTLTELAYLMMTRRDATPAQTRLLDAVLVSLADHGLTPSALAARLTFTGAPEAIQGSVAAGLLGAGSVFLGPTGDTAEFLAAALDTAGAGGPAGSTDPLGDAALSEIAAGAVAGVRARGDRVPGLGHPVHREIDPRTPRIYELAAEEDLLGNHLRLLRHVQEANDVQGGRRLVINGAGAGGALLVDLGIPPGSVRGFVLIARTAGLVAHLTEEAGDPLGLPLWLEVEERARASGDDHGGTRH